MSRKLIRCTGIEQEHRQACRLGHRSVAFVELITTAALALSTAVAVTAVSIGIARADVVGAAAKGRALRLRSRWSRVCCCPPWAR